MVVIQDSNYVAHYASYIVAFKEGKILRAGQREEIITSPMLSEIYDMQINIEEINNEKVCVYFK